MNVILATSIVLTAVILSAQKQEKVMNIAQEISIGLAGDTMLGRLVNDAITAGGYNWPWGTMLPILQSTDMNLVNLETTLTHQTKPVPKVFNFRADPNKVKSLTNAHIDVVNLANNHILDFGPLGLSETIDVLHQSNIATVGAGNNYDQAIKPAIIEKKGIRIGILGYTDNEADWKAQPKKPGTNYIEVGDTEPINKAVSALRPHADLIILSIHWGPNMRQEPTQKFQQFAHQIIDTGVDILHGHSAHITQGIEVYNKKLILYDSGDFVDDYAIDNQLRNDQSCFFIVKAEKNKLIQVQLIPTIIDNMQVNKAKNHVYSQILKRMRKLSKPFGTSIDESGIINIGE